MNFTSLEKIADAVLYEGYMLYPYRRSAVKNQQRFNFGVLYPREHCERNSGSECWLMQTECLIIGNTATPIEVKLRFLQMAACPVDSGAAGWQEGIAREVNTPACGLESITFPSHRQTFVFDAGIDSEGRRLGRLEGELEIGATRLGDGIYRVTIQIRNEGALQTEGETDRDEALLQALVSVHSILHVPGGRFISPMDPPEQYRALAQECRNIGTWPVMAGDPGQADFILSAPIILYDYPQIAPESPGDLCDATEIDEILALRILTLTDDEKREVRNGDDRARLILERTEMLPPEHFQKLHGALRGLRPAVERAQ